MARLTEQSQHESLPLCRGRLLLSPLSPLRAKRIHPIFDRPADFPALTKNPPCPAKRVWGILHTAGLFVKRRIKCVIILAVQTVSDIAQGFAEPLKMHDFPLPEEFDRVAHIRVVGQPEDVVICGARLLFCGQILAQVGSPVDCSAAAENGMPLAPCG